MQRTYGALGGCVWTAVQEVGEYPVRTTERLRVRCRIAGLPPIGGENSIVGYLIAGTKIKKKFHELVQAKSRNGNNFRRAVTAVQSLAIIIITTTGTTITCIILPLFAKMHFFSKFR